MPNEVLANEILPPLPEVALSEPDYVAFCGALEASARGRAFLAEYARRNRHANTEVLLGALDRLEVLVRSQRATTEADRIRQELRALLAALYAAKPTIDASAAAIKAAKLAAMIGFVQHRIESIVANEPSSKEFSPLPVEVAALMMAEQPVEAVRAYLAVVPRAEEPELPIPAPAATETRTIALVQQTAAPVAEPEPPAAAVVELAPEPTLIAEPARRTTPIIPVVSPFDSAPQPRAAVAEPTVANEAPAVVEPANEEPAAVDAIVVETAVAAMATVKLPQLTTFVSITAAGMSYEPPLKAEVTIMPAPEPLPVAVIAVPPAAIVVPALAETAPAPVLVNATLVTALPAPAEPVLQMPDDPLALIMALSEAERIALFT